MPYKVAMSELRLACLQGVDLDGDQAFIASATETAMVNRMISAEYGVGVYSVVAKAGLRYFETSTTIVTTGLAYIAEPTDHLATVDTIEYVLDSAGRLRRLRQLAPQERSYWAGQTGHALRWEHADDRINLYPTPPSGDQYILRYIPQPPVLTAYADGDLVDVVTADGLEALIQGTGVRLLGRIKSDPVLCLQQRDAARERLSVWASLKAFNDSPRIIPDDDDDDDAYLQSDYWSGR